MVRVFRASESPNIDESLWSFSYVDWQGKPRVGAGTESRQETKVLAERVQQEHDLLRVHRRKSLDSNGAFTPQPVLEPLPGVVSTGAASPSSGLAVYFGDAFTAAPSKDGQADEPLPQRIGERMVGAGLISGDDLSGALAYQNEHGGRLVEVLIEQQVVSPDAYLLFMGKLPGTPRIELGNCVQIPASVLQLIPSKMAAELEVIPVDRIGKILSVAMICPLDRVSVDRLHRHTGLQIRPMLCSHGEFRTALLRHYGRDVHGAQKRTAS